MTYQFEKEILEAGVNHDVIPSYAPFCETYLYLQEATERDYNQLMFDIGLSELGVLEATGVEVVYEQDEEKGQSFKDKVVKFVKERWEAVKAAFDKLLKTLQEKMANAKAKFTQKAIDKIKYRLKETDKDGVVKSYGKFYAYDKLDTVIKMNAGELAGDAEDETVIDLEYLRGDEVEVNKDWLLANFDKIINYSLEFKFTKGQILTPYNAVKKMFNAEIQDAKKAKDKEEVDRIKTVVTNLNKYAAAVVHAYHERQRLALAILLKVSVNTLKKSDVEKQVAKEEKEAAKAKKEAEKKGEVKQPAKKGKKAVNASAEMDGTPVMESYASEVEKMFDWNF